MIVDPREGDAEDDVAAMQSRSLAAIAGGMLSEINLIKLATTFAALVLAPAALLGLAPLVVTGWLASVSAEVRAVTTAGSLLILAGLLAVAWWSWRPLLKLVETNFWSLNAVLVQPTYLLSRELFRSVGAARTPGAGRQLSMRSIKLLSGLAIAVLPALAVWLAWPHTRWFGSAADLIQIRRLLTPALANAVVLMMGYAAFAGAAWGFSDATTAETVDLAPEEAVPGARIWRVAHLSDIHVVGERYGFRIESGRHGPRGNERLAATFAALDRLHAEAPLDQVVISGDMTDAGRSAEWAEFLDQLGRHPELARRATIIPGNHDVNIIDRLNPARLEAPWAQALHRRRARVLSAMAAVQGGKARVMDADGRPGPLLGAVIGDGAETLRESAYGGGVSVRAAAKRLWDDCFPNIIPPDEPSGLGVILLDSNAQTHFSFTNALGLLSTRQLAGVEGALRAWPGAGWLIVLHHHVVEYPNRASPLSERVGTALVNGQWVARALSRHADRIVVLHGHRHVDWVGRHGPLRIVSAPSPVMNQPDHRPSLMHVLRLQIVDGRLRLLAPEPVALPPVREGVAP
jgi:hypothetical protein